MLNRTIAPPVNQLEDFILPASEKVSLANGAEIYYLANTTQPVIRLEIVFPAGKWYEPAKGVSYFTSKLLLEGTKTKSAKQIADILDFYGASLECNQGFDWATLTLYCLSKHYLLLFKLVEEILHEASFPESEFKLLQQRTIQNLLVERKKPAYLASEKFSQHLFGKDHPYTSGLEAEAIKSLELNELVTFYHSNYSVSKAQIFLAGDISAEIKGTTEAIQANPGFISTFTPPNHSVFTDTQTEPIVIKDSLQSAIRIGKAMPLISHPDYLRLTVLNKILGGYFGSRLMKNIREDKGFTYGIHSSISPRKHASVFTIATDVKVDKAEETFQEISKEINRLQTDLVEEEELDTVRNFMLGKFLNDSTTVFDQADREKHLVLYGLDRTHYQAYLDTIRTTSPAALRELSQQYLENEFVRVYTTR